MKYRAIDWLILGSIWLLITLSMKSGSAQLVAFAAVVVSVTLAFLSRKHDN